MHNESYENMKILMEAIDYDKFKWQICGDLKVIALPLGLQQGFTKYCCFICEWDSRPRSVHYSGKDWPDRKSLEPGIMNVENQPVVEPSSRLRSGNACYYSVQNLLSSRMLSKNLKTKIYRTIILPVVLYGCEAWSLEARE